MKSRVQQINNEWIITIPKGIIDNLNLTPNSDVEVSLEGGRIIITTPPVVSLDDLVRGITDTNRHTAVDTGYPVGKEIW